MHACIFNEDIAVLPGETKKKGVRALPAPKQLLRERHGIYITATSD
jgi:hypothetical protein